MLVHVVEASRTEQAAVFCIVVFPPVLVPPLGDGKSDVAGPADRGFRKFLYVRDGIHGVNLANAAQLSSWLGKEVENPVDPELYAAELNKRIAAEGKFPLRA